MLKRLICILLVMMMLLCVVSCKQTPDDEKSSESTSESQGDEDLQPPSVQFDVPRVGEDGFEGFGGFEVNILHREKYQDELYAKKNSGLLLSETVYRRNQYVEEYLGIKLGWKILPDTHIPTYLEKLGLKKDHHIVSCANTYVSELIGMNLFTDLNSIPEERSYLNLSQPWWSQTYSEGATAFGKQFFALGDASTTATTELQLLTVNDQLLKKYVGIEATDLLNMVYDRTWSYEKFLEYVESVESNIIYGAALQRNGTSTYGFTSAFALPILERTNDLTMKLVYDSEQSVTIAQTLRDLYQKNPYVFGEQSSKFDMRSVDVFKQNEALFYAGKLIDVQDCFSKLSFDYTVLPFPIWDSQQAEYRVSGNHTYSVFGIFKQVLAYEPTTATMEVMAGYSYAMLRPALCEATYQNGERLTTEKSRMFDYILDHVYYDFGSIYGREFGNPVLHLFTQYIVYDKTDPNYYIEDLEEEIAIQGSKQQDLDEFISKLLTR